MPFDLKKKKLREVGQYKKKEKTQDQWFGLVQTSAYLRLIELIFLI